MSLSAQVTIAWADKDYLFGLNLAELEELQRLCGVGFGEIANRVFDGNYKVADIYQTIRLGLIGGGECSPTRARELMEAYVYGKPLNPLRMAELDGVEYKEQDPSGPVALATAVIAAVMNGIEADPPGEQTAGMGEASSMSPQSEPPGSNAESAPST